MINTKNKKGFTLIELLVVITIIGILATWATTVYTSQIQKARDTTRINDIKALQSSVEQVYQDRRIYPSWNAFLIDSEWVAVSTYMPKIPRDPKDWQTCSNWWDTNIHNACVYRYQTWADSNWIDQWLYVISTWFESLWKTQSDWKKDWWPLQYRWEIWNGIIPWTTLLNVWVVYSTSGCSETNVNKTTTWILNSTCTNAPSTKNELITIHWS